MSEFFFHQPGDKLRDVMIDVETLSLRPNAAIVSLGAVAFDMQSLSMGEKFYVQITPESCERVGMHIDGGTVGWWMRQSDDARKAFSGGVEVEEALARFVNWLDQHTLPLSDRCIWGNGANFDPVILGEAYRLCDFKFGPQTVGPVKFWNVRCQRTLRSLWPHVEAPKRDGTHHNALDDAIYQVECIFNIKRQLLGAV